MATEDPRELSAAAARYPHPPNRRLQVFSLDPAADVKLDTGLISRSVLNIPWERIGPGPVGEYVEVVDCDPSSRCVYDPVDLDCLLASDGLAPSTGNPQFHQQMVYAVAMLTIKNFEQVLGRKVTWSERRKDENDKRIRSFSKQFVKRLRIYPHALRQENAYYSPAKKALLFGYYNAPTDDPRDELPGGLVFTCLSHDIIAHETTHAILDGIHRRLLDASNPDMLAFHEAFADVVAIFQHFTLPGLLLDQIQTTRGDLQRNNLLAKLASQFARSTGRGDALRNALGEFDSEGNRQAPDPSKLGTTFEPHQRGAILVAAVFDAFIRIYENRVADLRRIATQGTGVLPEGDLHPDLAQRFASEAVVAAERVLRICVRAVDYLPPVDVTFGDYLRAMITADADLVPDDPRRYRLAFIEAFRDRGIYPLDVRTLAEDALLWRKTSEEQWAGFRDYLPPRSVLRTMVSTYNSAHMMSTNYIKFLQERSATWGKGDFDMETAERSFLEAVWIDPRSNEAPEKDGFDERYNRFVLEKVFAIFLHGWITARAKRETRKGSNALWAVEGFLGLDIEQLKKGQPMEVHAVRPTLRMRPDGRSKTELLIILTQKRFEKLYDENGEVMLDTAGQPLTFKYRGGCTLLIDPEEPIVRYSFSKNLCSSRRLQRHSTFLREQLANYGPDAVTRFGLTRDATKARQLLEPLALVHGSQEDPEGY